MHSSALSQLSPANLLENSASRHNDAEALVCTVSHRRFSFAELDERANRLANVLLAQGYGKGDVVAILCSNRVELVDWYFAIAKTGITGIPLNYRLAAAEITDLLQAMNASGFIYESRFVEVANLVREKLQGIRHTVRLGAKQANSAAGPETGDYDSLLQHASSSRPGVAIDEHDAWYFNLTSGTTGLPKSYTLSYYNNVLSTLQAVLGHDLTAEDTTLTAFPAFGRVGVVWILGSIMVGARNVLVNFEPEAALELIQQERVTFSNLVPTMAALMNAVPTLAEYDLSSLRGLVFAGAPLQAPVLEATRRRLCGNICEYYGMQESGILSVISATEKRLKPGSIGKPALFVDLRVVDDKNRDCAVRETGQIIARSPAATSSYFRNEEKSAGTFRNGWLYTGDLGHIDEEGFLTIAGRDKDMIISGGQNVFSVEVEEIILGMDGVADCAVIGLSHDVWGEMVTAVVQTDDASLCEELVIERCKAKLAGFKAPKKVIISEQPIPRTPTGKVTKYLLVEKYEQQQ